MTENNQLIKLDQDLSDEALAILKEQANTFPAVVTTEKQYKEVLEGHKKIKKIRIAVEKKATELVKDEKKTFESARANILNEETRIKLVLSPIETKLLETRTAWEGEKERVKQEKAEIEAKKQQAEHERQEKIREEIEAYAENEKFDQRKREDLERQVEDERLKKEKAKVEADRVAFEAEKEEFERKKETEFMPIKVVPESQPEQQSIKERENEKIEQIKEQQEIENPQLTNEVALNAPPTPEAKKALDDLGVKTDIPTMQDMANFDPDKQKFNAIFDQYNALTSLIVHLLEDGFADTDSTEAALYIKKRLDEFYKDVTTTITF